MEHTAGSGPGEAARRKEEGGTRMGTLEVHLFGTLRVWRDGRPIDRFPTKRVKELFSYLLLNRHTLHAREALADVFWDSAKERSPRHCLNTTLWRLQRVLGPADPAAHPYLHVDAQHIGFNTASDFRLDVAEFENRCRWAEQVGATAPEQRAALYRQAVELYQADLLVDCYDEWCLVERERLQRTYLRALAELIRYHAARGEHEAAIACAHQLLATDPLREDVHRVLIELYLATEQPAAALRHYQECEVILRRELSATPAPETQALIPQVFQRSRLAPAGVAPAAVPRSAPGAALPPAPPLLSRSDADSARQLSEAVAHLREAVAAFDTAHAQLRDAARAVEQLAHQVAHRLRDIAQPESPKPGQSPALGSAELEHIALLVGEAAEQLTHVPSRVAAK